jgi:lipoprotein-anchoring transpeptidase ErfK/SrfK
LAIGVLVVAALAALALPVATQAKARKAIVVSVGQQMMWVYKGDEVVLSSYVSTGRAGFETPLGTFFILTKLPSQTMEGVIGGEYYNVPDVPNVMYFTNQGHALHGTYWHNNFGTPMSHGCVNLPMDVAAWLYNWAPVGTPVYIVG